MFAPISRTKISRLKSPPKNSDFIVTPRTMSGGGRESISACSNKLHAKFASPRRSSLPRASGLNFSSIRETFLARIARRDYKSSARSTMCFWGATCYRRCAFIGYSSSPRSCDVTEEKNENGHSQDSFRKNYST